ncbi:uncharacterized protein LOC131691674 [Topomyia yanbarensis]|uniref:uncharacterized protein LOC131691674 n=1 Tax=Topomyia yanbarensis TaxID=2498891 RepID=UPI00273B0916|nr:uncharacterized protein LOC131691674 [Topomyia yanbarensis]
MKFCVLILFALAAVALSAPRDSPQILRSPRRADSDSTNSGGPVNFGFPVYNVGSWPGFGGSGLPVSQGIGGFGGGNLHGRFNFDDMPNVEGVSSGVTCTYSKDGKQKCTHHHQKH